MLEIKNTVRKMKNTFDGLVSMYGVAEERISKFNDRLIVMERKKEYNWYSHSLSMLFQIIIQSILL